MSTSKSTDYDAQSVVRLTPVEREGETIFFKWTGDLTGDTSPIEITIDQAKTVTATFEFAVYNGVVGKWVIIKENPGSASKSANPTTEINYVIFNADFTFEVGLSTGVVSGTFDIISNTEVVLSGYGAVDNISVAQNNQISFAIEITSPEIGTITQEVTEAEKDLTYDPVTKSLAEVVTSTISNTIIATTTTTTTTTTTAASTTTTLLRLLLLFLQEHFAIAPQPCISPR